jgi:hypothetical protein
VDGGWNVEQLVVLAGRLNGLGVNRIDFSSGGLARRPELIG